jgi:HNH endonuclease/AP2 domain
MSDYNAADNTLKENRPNGSVMSVRKREYINADYLREVINYDPETGEFVWRKPRRRTDWSGRKAGTKSCRYIVIRINAHTYVAQRLAWLHFYGSWPNGDVDHINGDPIDNRIKNLRVATVSENLANSKTNIRNTSGFKGVSRIKKTGKWCAYIRIMGKSINLGHYDRIEDAISARIAGASKYFGEFARHDGIGEWIGRSK